MGIEKRRQLDGKVRYRVKLRRRGFPPATATFATLADARKWERTTERDMESLRYFPQAEARRHTVSDAIARYLETVLTRKAPHTIAQQTQQLEWWQDRIGALTLDRLTPGIITGIRDELAAQNQPATVNHYLSPLRHVCSVAVNEWSWLETNPTRKVKRLAEPRGRARYLGTAERKRLLDACRASTHPHLYTIVMLALSTGGRKEELVRLKWSQLGPCCQRITLTETKNGEVRVLPVVGPALDLLRAHIQRGPVHGKEWVFLGARGKSPTSIDRAWYKALREAGIDDFKFHDLRHSCASYMAMSGASLADIATVLGHKSYDQVKRYAHLSESHVEGVVSDMVTRFLA